MTTPDLQIARLEAKTKRSEHLSKTAVELMKNPILEFAAGMLLIAVLEDLELQQGSGNHVLEGPEALAARLWVATMISIQQAAPLLPYAADALKGIAGALPALPLLAGAL